MIRKMKGNIQGSLQSNKLDCPNHKKLFVSSTNHNSLAAALPSMPRMMGRGVVRV